LRITNGKRDFHQNDPVKFDLHFVYNVKICQGEMYAPQLLFQILRQFSSRWKTR
jgi:hypothetical protein